MTTIANISGTSRNSFKININDDANTLELTPSAVIAPGVFSILPAGAFYLTAGGPIEITPSSSGVLSLNCSGGGGVEIHSTDGAGIGLKMRYQSTSDTGGTITWENNGSIKWAAGSLGDGTNNWRLWNNAAAADAIAVNSSTNLITIAALSVAGAFSVDGDATIGNASGDVVTVNSQVWTVANGIQFKRTAVASTAETIASFVVSDDAVGSLAIVNGTSNNSTFAPKIQGVQAGANVVLNFNGQGTTDTGANPVILFSGQIGSSTVATRPVVGFWNQLTPIVELTGGYNLQLKGGATSPSLAGAAADVVSLAAVDKAAGDRRLYVQSESGSAISLGNDRLNFAAATGIISIGGTDTVSVTTTSITLADAVNIAVGSTSGTKIGTATTQKIGLWNASPVAQYSTTGTASGFTAGSGTAVKDDSTFTGNTGSTAYRISDVVRALKLCGIMAS